MNGKQWTQLEDMGEQIDEMVEFLTELDGLKIAEISKQLQEAKNLIDEALTTP